MNEKHAVLVMHLLKNGPAPATSLRSALTHWGVKIPQARFDQMMAALEKKGEVVGYNVPNKGRFYEVPK